MRSYIRIEILPNSVSATLFLNWHGMYILDISHTVPLFTKDGMQWMLRGAEEDAVFPDAPKRGGRQWSKNIPLSQWTGKQTEIDVKYPIHVEPDVGVFLRSEEDDSLQSVMEEKLGGTDGTDIV